MYTVTWKLSLSACLDISLSHFGVSVDSQSLVFGLSTLTGKPFVNVVFCFELSLSAPTAVIPVAPLTPALKSTPCAMTPGRLQ